jgi:hypothetical protein
MVGSSIFTAICATFFFLFGLACLFPWLVKAAALCGQLLATKKAAADNTPEKGILEWNVSDRKTSLRYIAAKYSVVPQTLLNRSKGGRNL